MLASTKLASRTGVIIHAAERTSIASSTSKSAPMACSLLNVGCNLASRVQTPARRRAARRSTSVRAVSADASLPELKLTYFNVQGAGEKVRLALALGGIPFEDERVPFSKWRGRGCPLNHSDRQPL